MFWFEKPHYVAGKQVNPYYWYWHDFKCRLEPFTYEWRRHVQKWWIVDLVLAGILLGLLLWFLLFPPWVLPFWLKITILVVGVLGLTFYGWLLLHLGGFASLIIKKLRGIFT